MTRSLIYLQPYGAALSYSAVHRTLLDTLEAYHVRVEFQCRSGYCGACRLRLLAGGVKYYREPLAFIDRWEILPCCCLPVNDIRLEL